MRQKASAPASLQKAPATFCSDLDHASVPFRLIVVEGHGEVVAKPERLVVVRPEPLEEIARRALLAPPTPSLASGGRVGGQGGVALGGD
jgi:hypothetical protein